jgi:hypothetical protein
MIALYRGSFIVKIFTPGASLASKSEFLPCSASVPGKDMPQPLQIVQHVERGQPATLPAGAWCRILHGHVP